MFSYILYIKKKFSQKNCQYFFLNLIIQNFNEKIDVDIKIRSIHLLFFQVIIIKMTLCNNKYCLNHKCLKEIPTDKYEKNFTFIVNGKKYETNRFIADILSPKIRRLHFIDSTVNEFRIEFKRSIDEDCFSDFLNLASFKNMPINPIQKKIFSEYFYKLGNIEEYTKLNTEKVDDFTGKTAVNYLKPIDQNFIYISNNFNFQI